MLIATSALNAQTVEHRAQAYVAKAKPIAEPWTLTSGEEQNLLLEMYTALNCPGCPPADAWMDFFAEQDLGSRKRTELWNRLIPVVWHVTYFDRPGQADPLGQELASMRQQFLVRALGIDKGSYTPALFTNGREWRGLYKGEALSLTPRTTGEMRLANLGGDKGFTVEFKPAPGFDPKARNGEMHGWIVLQVGGLYTDPRRGPGTPYPRASTFAVQAWKTAKLTQTDGKWTGKFDALPLEAVRKRWPGATLSLAAWVSNEQAGFQPVQAVGTWVK